MTIRCNPVPVVAIVVGLVVPALQSQNQNSGPTFDVVSVKPAARGRHMVQSDPGRLTIANESLEVLIKLAYGLREYQFEGPDWLHNTRYDVIATFASPVARSQQLVMLRAMLVDRFKLKMHQESRKLPIYALVIGPNGAKLKPPADNLSIPVDMVSNIGMFPVSGGFTELRGNVSLGVLSDFLGRLVGRPVLDRTGLGGLFDIRLLCAIDGYPGFDTSPTVFDALSSQLGLKLQGGASQVDVTVVDHVEAPSGN